MISIIPKIIVKRADCSDNIECITELLIPEYSKKNKSLPFVDRVYGLLPELKDKIHGEMTKEQIRNIMKKLFMIKQR